MSQRLEELETRRRQIKKEMDETLESMEKAIRNLNNIPYEVRKELLEKEKRRR